VDLLLISYFEVTVRGRRKISVRSRRRTWVKVFDLSWWARWASNRGLRIIVNSWRLGRAAGYCGIWM
jgi:hypothetical protein